MSKQRLKLFTPICAKISERTSLSSDGALGAMCISACSCPGSYGMHRGEDPRPWLPEKTHKKMATKPPKREGFIIS